MKLLEKVIQLSDLLSKYTEDPMKEAEIIVNSALSIDTASIYRSDLTLQSHQHKRINDFLARRLKGEPIQYITGCVSFFDLNIKVGSGVFIPRPETEFMVECAITFIKDRLVDRQPSFILDLCTGSGCIALAMANYFPEAAVIGIDISASALGYARDNQLSNHIKNVSFICGDLFEPFKHDCFDVIISNPPYIKTDEVAKLQREVSCYEPFIALDGGQDGLRFYRVIFDDAKRFLTKDGIVIVEMGYGQAEEVINLAKRDFSNLKVIKDYSGIERILIAEL